MTINTQKQVAAIEAGNYQQEEVVETTAQNTKGVPITLEQVITNHTYSNNEERPVHLRNIKHYELLSERDNPYVRVEWEYQYQDHDNAKWWSKKGVIFDGQGKLVHDFLVEFGIDENETYIVKSKQVKGKDGKKYSQWVSFCHISAFDEVA